MEATQFLVLRFQSIRAFKETYLNKGTVFSYSADNYEGYRFSEYVPGIPYSGVMATTKNQGYDFSSKLLES
jgi:hypothetical protein